ncbi:MAG: sn-glycerol-1-phosphate dehydrogenase, partial [Treponema sp.]|nr:sn-glycerol-1-phosphate dehydrogenase [Treponema sp.]
MRIKLPTIEFQECIAISGGTKELLSGNGVYQKVPELLKNHFNSNQVFLIADTNTMNAAGNKLEEILLSQKIKIKGKYVFAGEPRLHADYCHVETLVSTLNEKCADSSQQLIPVSIGSGTINDLVKQAASETKLPYVCIPTAASVDGYTSFGSAILKDGFKQTLPCEAPLAIAADTNIMADAPVWLTSSGFGDLAGKIIAGADWIISDHVSAFGAKGADSINPKAWAMVQHGLCYYLDRSLNAVYGDQDSLEALFEALSITGFAMQYTRSSRPVSGAEHLFAHIWEMENLSMNGNPVTHGHKVAIGTLVCTDFLETLFADPNSPPSKAAGKAAGNFASFRRPSFDQRINEIKLAFDKSPALESVIITAAEKFPDEKTLKTITEGVHDTWKTLREKVLEQIIPYNELKAKLEKAQCPVTSKQINLSRAEVINCARRA